MNKCSRVLLGYKLGHGLRTSARTSSNMARCVRMHARGGSESSQRRLMNTRAASDVSRMEDLIDDATINSFLKGDGSFNVASEPLPAALAASSPTSSSSSRLGGSRSGSTIAQEIHDMERESNFMQIREEARELKTVLDVTRYARSYLPGKLVSTDMSIAFISEELLLPLMPNENFLDTWGSARLTYLERRKIMEKIHLLEDK